MNATKEQIETVKQWCLNHGIFIASDDPMDWNFVGRVAEAAKMAGIIFFPPAYLRVRKIWAAHAVDDNLRDYNGEHADSPAQAFIIAVSKYLESQEPKS